VDGEITLAVEGGQWRALTDALGVERAEPVPIVTTLTPNDHVVLEPNGLEAPTYIDAATPPAQLRGYLLAWCTTYESAAAAARLMGLR